MVFGEVLAGAAAGAHSLWNYNRDNFMFDREMRQKTEYQILGWRSKQAALWREDVRDIIGLTEKKMDTYLVVTVLQLTMCLGMFTEGRLEPGTPPWLLHLYMLTLGATFMYLLMSVWLAMHASIVATCSSVRILTQFVRLPVPTWEQLEGMRTYAQAWENIEANKMLRVPFLPPLGARTRSRSSSREASGSPKQAMFSHFGKDACTGTPPRATFSSFARGSQEEAPNAVAGAATQLAAADAPAAEHETDGRPAGPLRACDPWGTELHGSERDLQELQHMPAALRRHVGLARRAAAQYQCYDAFARVAMAFGTNQMLFALAYYVLGYVAVQDGAPMAAWCIVFLVVCMAVAMVQLDFSLSERQRAFGQMMMVIGPACASAATYLWATREADSQYLIFALLPVAYTCHGLWLYFALLSCGMELQPNGAVLPVNFRAVLYLDVFGWYGHHGDESVSETQGYHELPQSPKRNGQVPRKQPDDALSMPATSADASPASKIAEDLGGVGSAGSSPAQLTSKRRLSYGVDSCACVPSDRSPSPTRSPARFLDAQALTFDEESPMYVRRVAEALSPERSQSPKASPRTASAALERAGSCAMTASRVAIKGPAGEVVTDHPEMFHPTSFAPIGDEDVDIVTGHHVEHPGQVPARIFRFATTFVVVLWALGAAWPFCGDVVRDLMTKPLAPKLVVEEIKSKVGEEDVMEQSDHFKNRPVAAERADAAELPLLPEGELVEVAWPSHSGFVPHSLSSDPSGQQLVVADDLGVYTGKVAFVSTGDHAVDKADRKRSLRGASSSGAEAGTEDADGEADTPRSSVSFARAPACPSLEGQEVQDMGVVCTSGSHSECRVVVLHTHGHRLSECPIPSLSGLYPTGALEAPSQNSTLVGVPEDGMTSWMISDEWLRDGDDGKEFVESLAVNSKCLHSPSQSVREGNAFRPDRLGCVTVGTSGGRVVQLRGSFSGEHRLVPERAIQQDEQELGVRHGTLHVFPDGRVMALRRSDGTVATWDAESGSSTGEWRLPAGVHWLALCGGGDSLYVLGVRNQTRVELRRFPVPAALQGALRGEDDSHTDVEATEEI